MDAIQCNLDMFVDSIVNAQKDIAQPQVISPKGLVDNLRVLLLFLRIPPYYILRARTQLIWYLEYVIYKYISVMEFWDM
jgi:hypothetical protein